MNSFAKHIGSCICITHNGAQKAIKECSFVKQRFARNRYRRTKSGVRMEI
jgi:hypothetical protein